MAGLGYDVTDVRAGKVFDLELEAADEADALRIADEISERVLSNPLIEDYRVGGSPGSASWCSQGRVTTAMRSAQSA